MTSTLHKVGFLARARDYFSGHRLEWLLVLGLVLAAAILRLVWLTGVPPGLHGDEAITAMEARRILEEGPIGPWSQSIHGQPAGPFYWIAFWYLFLPETHFTVRLTTALLGIAAVPVFYLFCRELVGRRAALFGATALTFSYWAIHFSRTAFPLAAVPVVECAALYFLVRGVRRRQRWAVALGGVLLGAGIYTYGSYPFLLPMLAIPALLLLLVRRRDGGGLALDRRRVGDLALAGIAALAAAGPFLTFALRNPGTVTGASNVQLFADAQLFQQAGALESLALFGVRLLHACSAYFIGIQRDSVDGMGLWGMLDPVAGVLLVAGLAVALRRFLDWRHALLVCGLLAGIVPVVLLAPGHTEGMLWAEYRRSIIALPFVFAAVGLGAEWLLDRATRLFSSARRPWPVARQQAAATVVIILMLSASLSIQHYFVSWARDDFSRWVFVHDLVQVVEFLDSEFLDSMEGPSGAAMPESEGPVVYFYSPRWSYDYPTRRFLLPDLAGKDRSAEFGEFDLARLPQHRHRPVIYVLMPPYDRYLDEVRGRHPGGSVTRLVDDGEVVFVAYYLEVAAPTSEGGGPGL